MKTLKCIKEIIQIAIDRDGENEYFECEIELKEEGKTFKAHEVSICKRDLVFFTDKGALNYDVNTIGSNDSLLLVYMDEDN